MCGIFAVIGDNPEALRLLIEGLQRLEYRGYDSAGVCVWNENEKDILTTTRATGKVSSLKNKIGDFKQGTMGIAHTRWATHGKPCDDNSHPHLSSNQKIAVVHNGIIENYSVLKSDLEAKGYVFRSETDSEVLATLVEDMMINLPEKDLAMVVSAALELCIGTFGCVFLFREKDNLMIGARRGSPLILGLIEDKENPKSGKNQYYLASDACAIVGHTRDVVYINDGETIECTRSGYRIHDTRKLAKKARLWVIPVKDGQQGSLAGSSDAGMLNPVVRLEMKLDEIEKGGYDHFMLKEIHDQDSSLGNCIRGRLRMHEGTTPNAAGGGSGVAQGTGSEKVSHHPSVSVPLNPEFSPVLRGSAAWESTHNLAGYTINLGGLEHVVEDGGATVSDRMLNAPRIIMAACGTSWHSCLIGEYMFEQIARIPVEVEYASEFRYRKPLIRESDVVIGISQSGETADTLEALRLAQSCGATTFGIVNVVGSTIARETDAGMYIHAGPEVGVASTKAFTGQVLSLFLLSLALAKKSGALPDAEFQRLCEECLCLPDMVKYTIDSCMSSVKTLAREVRLANNFLFLGRGMNFPVALEGALKLKEISYIHAEGYPAAEMKHGPIALIDQFMPVVIIAPRNDPTYLKIKANIEEVSARSGDSIIITDEGNTELDKFSNHVIYMPTVDQYLQPIINSIPLQLLSYYVAKARGCEIDQPRNLAKSVTVE